MRYEVRAPGRSADALQGADWQELAKALPRGCENFWVRSTVSGRLRSGSCGRLITYVQTSDAESEAKVEEPSPEGLGRDRRILRPNAICRSTLAERGDAGHSRGPFRPCISRRTHQLGWHGTRQERASSHCHRRRGLGCGSQAGSFVCPQAEEEDIKELGFVRLVTHGGETHQVNALSGRQSRSSFSRLNFAHLAL